MMSRPVPTVKRSRGRSGFFNRIRFTSYPLALRFISRAFSLLRRNRSRIDKSTREPGTIFFGARAFLVFEEGSTKLVMNHRANQPGSISLTIPDGSPLTEADIEDR